MTAGTSDGVVYSYTKVLDAHLGLLEYLLE